MSPIKIYIFKRVSILFTAAALVFLYCAQYASIKLFPSFKNIFSVELSEEAPYDDGIHQQDFYNQWCRSREAVRNWRAMIRPCLGLLTWESRQSIPEYMETDAWKSFVVEKDIRPAGEFSRITIVTKTKRGLKKTYGGDSWRVKVNGTASVNARVIDHNNGTYDVLFLIMDQGTYHMHIYLDYSICNGLRDPPEHWFKKGNAQGKYQGVHVIGTPQDLLMHPLMGTPIRIDIKERKFREDTTAPKCKNACNILWNGRGRWINATWIPYFRGYKLERKSKIEDHKSSKGNLLVYGDSVNVFFAQSLKQRRNICGGIFSSCSFSYNWIYQVGNVSAAKTKRDDNDIDIKRILDDFEKTITDSKFNNEGSLVIVNFGLHFVESTNFSNYQRLVDDLAKMLTVTDATGKNKYRGRVLWKTTTAINKERADFPQLHWRRFFTNYRIQLYNAYAVDVMCKYGISVVDVYSISESYPYGTGTHRGRSPSKNDIVHYNNEAFYPLEEFIQEYF